jgi:uncharacterized integral membrane protein
MLVWVEGWMVLGRRKRKKKKAIEGLLPLLLLLLVFAHVELPEGVFSFFFISLGIPFSFVVRLTIF